MACEVKLSRSAEKFLKRAPRDLAERIDERLRELSENPICEERLKGALRGLCKTRVGDYRIVYQLKPCTVMVIDIGHRERFYDKLKRLLK
ncbi:MAG: type II toxin-antitoxin system RelE family toxin [Candidatus Nezhaarchaeales archaeon]